MDSVIPPILRSRKINSEPDWSRGEPGGNYGVKPINNDANDDRPVQQSDMLKPLYMDIVENGLTYTYEQNKSKPDPFAPPALKSTSPDKTSKPKKVIIIGAGMAGLSAAYELQRSGHTVLILEMQQRVGGRVKTFGEKDGFDKDLYVDGKYTHKYGREGL